MYKIKYIDEIPAKIKSRVFNIYGNHDSGNNDLLKAKFVWKPDLGGWIFMRGFTYFTISELEALLRLSKELNKKNEKKVCANSGNKRAD